MWPRDPKQEPFASRFAAKSKPSSPPRRQKPKPVIYKSSALNRAAPSLVAAADPTVINNTLAIQQANAEAERVRDAFKVEKCGPDVDVGDGDDEATNAKKYERRLLMNRHSAAASRVRREAYTKALEAQLVQHEAMLKQVNALLEMEREKNRQLVAETGYTGSEEANDDENDDVDGHYSEVEDIGLDAALSAGLVVPTTSSQLLPESQTEDNDNSAAPMANPLHTPSSPTMQTALAQIPPSQRMLFAPMKLEEILQADPLPTDAFPSEMSNEKLLECFLYDDNTVVKEADIGTALDFS